MHNKLHSKGKTSVIKGPRFPYFLFMTHCLEDMIMYTKYCHPKAFSCIRSSHTRRANKCSSKNTSLPFLPPTNLAFSCKYMYLIIKQTLCQKLIKMQCQSSIKFYLFTKNMLRTAYQIVSLSFGSSFILQFHEQINTSYNKRKMIFELIYMYIRNASTRNTFINFRKP